MEYTGPQQGALPASVKPGEARTLGYGTDQGRWLAEELRNKAAIGEAPNRFRCADIMPGEHTCRH